MSRTHLLNLLSHLAAVVRLLSLCDPMDFSMPGSPVLHHLLEFAQIHVHEGHWALHMLDGHAEDRGISRRVFSFHFLQMDNMMQGTQNADSQLESSSSRK